MIKYLYFNNVNKNENFYRYLHFNYRKKYPNYKFINKMCLEKILIFFFNKILTIIRYIQILKNLHYLWDEFNTIYKEFIY